MSMIDLYAWCRSSSTSPQCEIVKEKRFGNPTCYCVQKGYCSGSLRSTLDWENVGFEVEGDPTKSC